MLHRFDPGRGNAPAEFVLVSGLLVALAAGLIHTSLVIHVRHVLQASAWEGARLASYYDTEPSEGVALATSLVSEAIGERYSQDIHVRQQPVGGQPGVVVTIVAPVPTVGLWSIGGEMRVDAAAALEIPG